MNARGNPHSLKGTQFIDYGAMFNARTKVIGTNCYNCLFVSNKEESVNPSELNEQGGLDPKTKDEMQRAQKADLITLPGGSKADAANKKFCSNEKVKMFVIVRMCCGYWDNTGVKRPWKK